MLMSGGGYHYKMLLALVLIVGIVGLLAYTNTGQDFLKNFKIGRFADVQTPTSSQSFGITLTTEVTALYGKSFELSNSVINLDGICNTIKISSLTLERENTRCAVESGDFTGSFEYSPFGSISLIGKTTSIKLDSDKYTSDVPVNFEIELIPTSFFVSGVTADKLSLIAPSGKIEKYTDSELKGISYLSQTTLEISNLAGTTELDTGTLKVSGTVTSVKSEEFSW